jgi:hypothetical protein
MLKILNKLLYILILCNTWSYAQDITLYQFGGTGSGDLSYKDSLINNSVFSPDLLLANNQQVSMVFSCDDSIKKCYIIVNSKKQEFNIDSSIWNYECVKYFNTKDTIYVFYLKLASVYKPIPYQKIAIIKGGSILKLQDDYPEFGIFFGDFDFNNTIDMAVFDGEWCISMFNIKKDKIKKAKFKIILTGNVNISAKIVDFKRSRWKNLRKAYNK